MDEALPERLRRFFWEVDREADLWPRHRDYVAMRLLAEGNGEAVSWVRDQLGDAGLAALLRSRSGRGLSPQQLRYWEIILDLPHDEVTAWIDAVRRLPWSERATL